MICAICQEDLKESDGYNMMCGHQFHASCVAKWLETSSGCPVCRKDFHIDDDSDSSSDNDEEDVDYVQHHIEVEEELKQFDSKLKRALSRAKTIYADDTISSCCEKVNKWDECVDMLVKRN